MLNKEIVEKKIVTKESLSFLLTNWRFKNKKIVFTNGCFDLLHAGHIETLTQSADQGDVLIVGLNSDSSVKLLNKGSNRPLQNQHARSIILASLHFVTAVILFEEETPYELIKLINPDVLVKGGDYKISEIAGSDIVLKNGGEVKLIQLVEGLSTSNLESKIKNS